MLHDRPRGHSVPDGGLSSVLSVRDWGDLKSLPPLLPEVPSLPEYMIPAPLRGWIVDFAERAQMPLDFIAAPAIVALSSLVGRNIGIHPKQQDNWLVVPNLWGAAIGRPGVMKSAAIAEALRPLGHLVATAIEEHEGAAADAKMARQNLEDEITVERGAFKANLKAGKTQEADRNKKRLTDLQRELDDANPKERRFIANDATTEKLAEILKDNPRGFLMSRDELSGWLRTLDRSGREGDREFFLESWNGNGAFTYDRIGRGTIHIPALCLGIVGGIQPGKLQAYQSAAMQGGVGDDGLLQRFQMLVWPAVSSDWCNIDRAPYKEGRERADWVFQQIDGLKPEGVGADAGFGDIPALHFDGEAQELFNEWRGKLERRLRGGSEDHAPAFESHLSKYRSLLPSLALIFHLIEVVAGGESGPVTLDATRLAAAWCEFLEAHARKVYAAELNHDLAAAHAIEGKIRGGAVEDGGRVRDIYRHHWAGISTPDELWSGLRVLEKHNIVRVEEQQGEGRSADIIRIRPRTAA